MMQAFLWRHLVPARDLSANVPPDALPRLPIKLINNVPVTIPAGGSTSVQVGVDTFGVRAAGPVQFELVDPPAGISVQSAGPAGGHVRMVLACDAQKLKPGFKGNLIAVAFVMATPPPQQPVPVRPRRDPAEIMRALKDAPTSPDKSPLEIVETKPNHDQMSFDLDSLTASMQARPAREPEATPSKPLPPQKVTLGTLPAIAFEVVKP
jgi:hypothetical protein